MTKKEFQTRFKKEAVDLMSNPAYLIVLDVAREDCPYANGGGATEATSIIRNEGRMTGWNECLRFLKSIAKSEPEPVPQKPTPLYTDPNPPRKSDQNK